MTILTLGEIPTNLHNLDIVILDLPDGKIECNPQISLDREVTDS